MPDPCPKCGKDLALVGRAHNCVSVALKSTAHPKGPKAKHHLNPKSIVTEEVDKDELLARIAETAKTTGALRIKLGRPRIGDADKTLKAQQPWKAAGMSRSTWYRRQAEKRGQSK